MTPKAKAELLAHFLSEHKAEDTNVISIKDLNPFADYYVIATANNIRHVGALADLVEDFLRVGGDPINKINGKPESGWVIVDANEVVVHIFTKEKRDEVSLEDLIETICEFR